MLTFPVACLRFRGRTHFWYPAEPGASTPPFVSIECQLSGCQRVGFGRHRFVGVFRYRGTKWGVFSMVRTTIRTMPRDKSTARRLTEKEAVAAAFSTDLGWMAVAHADAVVCGIVFGHATQRQAIDSLRRHLGRRGTSLCRRVGDRRTTSGDCRPHRAADCVRGRRTCRLQQRASRRAASHGLRPPHREGLPAHPARQDPELRRIGNGIGSPGAARAVGQVMAKNCYPLIVPCHRVLAAGGKLGGFSAPQGLAMKRRLLELEVESHFDS